MKSQIKILLPGLRQQINFLKSKIKFNDSKILVIGSNSGEIANLITSKNSNKIELIVEDYESLINTKLVLDKEKNVNAKIMSFEHTDFIEDQFDLVYAQATISNSNRKNIVKEIKRILKPDGIFCIGEIVKLQNEVPTFVKDIFETSDIDPIKIEDLEKYYLERNFELIDSKDLSKSLNEFYSVVAELSKSKMKDLNENEKSYHKKFLNQMKHESHAFLKLGADKFIGFKTLILKKK
ncbi:MAG: methyltransferase domain-containing protein [Ignavibacteriae bacterium]|nr:methyltransferase domain-containing protein [Ignavibacteriota bacterium]